MKQKRAHTWEEAEPLDENEIKRFADYQWPSIERITESTLSGTLNFGEFPSLST